MLIALIALAVCLMTRRRNMERARLELAARSSNWFDPKLVTVGVQIAQQIGWRRLVSLAGAALLAAGLAREWSGRESSAADEDQAASEG